MLKARRDQVHRPVQPRNRCHRCSIIDLEAVRTIVSVVMLDWTKNCFTMPNMNRYMTNRHIIPAASIIQVSILKSSFVHIIPVRAYLMAMNFEFYFFVVENIAMNECRLIDVTIVQCKQRIKCSKLTELNLLYHSSRQ